MDRTLIANERIGIIWLVLGPLVSSREIGDRPGDFFAERLSAFQGLCSMEL
jgi:hypothetical protein